MDVHDIERSNFSRLFMCKLKKNTQEIYNEKKTYI